MAWASRTLRAQGWPPARTHPRPASPPIRRPAAWPAGQWTRPRGRSPRRGRPTPRRPSLTPITSPTPGPAPPRTHSRPSRSTSTPRSYTIARRKLAGGRAAAARRGARRGVRQLLRLRRTRRPRSDAPFAVHIELRAVAVQRRPPPPARRRQGRKVDAPSERKPAHLVFLVDVSGSMRTADKLPLAKRALRILVENLQATATRSRSSPTPATRAWCCAPTGLEHARQILAAIDELDAERLDRDGLGHRAGLPAGRAAACDRDVDLPRHRALRRRRQRRRHTVARGDPARSSQAACSEGVTLSTIGFGMGNYKDALMEQLADKGDGNYYYVDALDAGAAGVPASSSAGTLEVIAKDVKVQVEFDPAAVDALPPARLREPRRRRPATSATTRSTPARSARATRSPRSTRWSCAAAASAGRWPPCACAPSSRAATRPASASRPLATERRRARSRSASTDFRFAAAVAAAAEILRGSADASEWSLARRAPWRGRRPASRASARSWSRCSAGRPANRRPAWPAEVLAPRGDLAPRHRGNA